MAMTLNSRRRRLWAYIRAPLMGAILGWAVVLGLARHYASGEVLTRTFQARFEWDSVHGVKEFRLEDSPLGERVGADVPGGIWLLSKSNQHSTPT